MLPEMSGLNLCIAIVSIYTQYFKSSVAEACLKDCHVFIKDHVARRIFCMAREGHTLNKFTKVSLSVFIINYWFCTGFFFCVDSC